MSKNTQRAPRVLISGGGTGGHIFPALSIANALKRRLGAEILFVGAEDRMEMQRVPAAGYKIIGLPVAGFDRRRPWRNIGVLLKLRKSLGKARKIVRDFRPDIAIGVGGYASGPTLKAAQRLGVPTLLQEQNSYAGVTNKLLAKRAERICVAYEGMERFFPAGSIVMTGNPVRKDLLAEERSVGVARQSFGLDPAKETLLVVGGSLGALTLNESLEQGLKTLVEHGWQVIWQTGRYFTEERARQAAKGLKGVVVTQFISDMAAAYRAATLVVSRAGAGTISELELLGKPCILVPSPNVAGAHEPKRRGTAVMVSDAEARQRLILEIERLMANPQQLKNMSAEILKLGIAGSDEKIVDEVVEIIERVRK